MPELRRMGACWLVAVAAWAGAGAAERAAEPERRPWMGVFLGDAVDGGVQVVALVPGGPAQEGGLRRGDVLVRLGELAVADISDFERALVGRSPGEELAVRVLRGGVPSEHRIALEVRPSRGGPLDAVLRLARPAAVTAPVGAEVEVVDITPELRAHFGAPPEAGVLITRVGRETPAARSGIAAGDVLIRLDERPVAAADRVLAELARPRAKGATLVRDGRTMRIGLVADGARAAPRAAAREEAIRREIVRLERRIEELRRELERLDAR